MSAGTDGPFVGRVAELALLEQAWEARESAFIPIDLGECTWGAIGSTRAVVDELEAKVRAFPNTRGDTIGRRLFARTVPAAAEHRATVHWYSLEALYAEPAPRARKRR